MKRVTGWLPLVVAVAIGLFIGLTAPAGRASARQLATTSASQTFTVNVDGYNAKINESFLGYFPRAVTVHAGDTVVFHYVGVGEPHTVTLGSLANSAVAAYNKLTPAQQNAPTPPASFRAIDATLPNLFP